MGICGYLGVKVAIQARPYFRGQSIHRLDAKGRLRIPTKFREVLQKHYTDTLIVTQWGPCLGAFPLELWDQIEQKAANFSLVDPSQQDFKRYFISSAQECPFDSQGRILIPPVLRDYAGLDQEVFLAGTLNNFEIWDKGRWDRQMESNREKHQEIMETMATMGL